MADISPFKLTAAMSAVSQLKAELSEYASEDILASIESETNALELMDKLIERVMADEALADSAKQRAKRLEERADGNRVVLRAMMVAIAEKVQRPLATLSVSYHTKPIVTDATALPETLMRHAPDMKLIERALKDGDVPGVTKTNPEPRLTIRKA
jgi:hypothetical protein